MLDPTLKKIILRLISQEIAALESRKEQLSARLLDMDNIRSQEALEEAAKIGKLMYDLHQLRRLEARYKGEPA